MSRQTTILRWVCACLLGWGCLIVAPAAAQSGRAAAREVEPEGYRQLVDEALAEYASGNFEEVRSLFQRAHTLFPNARTLRGLGMAEFELRNYARSAELLQQALDSTKRPLSPELRRDTAALLSRAQGFLARVRLELTPATAEVQLDGQVLAPPQPELIVQIGHHELSFRAPGYVSQARSLDLSGGERLTLEVSLEAEKPVAPTPRAVASSAQSSTLAPADDGARRDSARPPLYKNPWLWTGVGVVVVGAIVTAIVVPLTRSDPAASYYGGDSNTVLHAQ